MYECNAMVVKLKWMRTQRLRKQDLVGSAGMEETSSRMAGSQEASGNVKNAERGIDMWLGG